MKARVTEIAADVYRISAFNPDYGIQFNQFLVKDEAPFLMHTGLKKMFPIALEAVASVISPAKLRWIGYSHFEPDECGALNEWLQAAPQAQALASFVGTKVMLSDFAERPARPLADNETIDIGSKRLRFLSTPHVPHGWDSGLFFEESGGTLFCSDLFFHPGDPEPLTESDIVGRAKNTILHTLSGPMSNDLPYTQHTDPTIRRLADLKPRTLALMHGSSFQGDCQQALSELATVLKENLSN